MATNRLYYAFQLIHMNMHATYPDLLVFSLRCRISHSYTPNSIICGHWSFTSVSTLGSHNKQHTKLNMTQIIFKLCPII